MGLWDNVAAGEHDYYDVNDDGRIDAFEAGMMMYERDMEENWSRLEADDLDEELCFEAGETEEDIDSVSCFGVMDEEPRFGVNLSRRELMQRQLRLLEERDRQARTRQEQAEARKKAEEERRKRERMRREALENQRRAERARRAQEEALRRKEEEEKQEWARKKFWAWTFLGGTLFLLTELWFLFTYG